MGTPEHPPGSNRFTDIHVHGVPRLGVDRVPGWRKLLFALFARQTGVSGTGPEAVTAYMAFLIQSLRSSRQVRRAVLLALDQAYDQHGRPEHAGSSFSVSNEDVLYWCRKHPELFLFGASVHPHRPDALAALEQCAEQGAVLVKWLPNHQRIDPAAPRHRPYYRKLVELGLPLLSHSGHEFALPAIDQSLGRQERLTLPLDQGVTVIAAHSGSAGIFCNRPAMERFSQALHRFPNLYGDTAGLALPNRMTALLWWRYHPELANRLLFATDYPVQLFNPVWRLFLPPAAHARFRAERNPFDRMAVLLQSLGINLRPDGFEALLEKIGQRG